MKASARTVTLASFGVALGVVAANCCGDMGPRNAIEDGRYVQADVETWVRESVLTIEGDNMQIDYMNAEGQPVRVIYTQVDGD